VAQNATPACSVEAAKNLALPRPRKPRRVTFFAWSACYLMIGAISIALLGGGFLVARLARGPVAIEGLGPRIASALDQRFGRGYDFTLGQTAMIKRGFAPTLSIDGLSLKDRSGRTILSAPRAEVSVDLFSLMAGHVVPKRLEVFDVEVRLALLPDGSIAQPIAPDSEETVALTPPLADSLVKEGAPNDLLQAAPGQNTAGQGAGASVEPKPRTLLVKQMASALRLLIDSLTNPDSQIAAVDRVGVSRGRVVIDDRSAHQKMTFDGVNLSFDRTSGATTFNLSVDGPNGRWSASGFASGAPRAERRLMLSLQNLSIDEILLATGARSIGADFDMPLSAKFSVGLRPDGVLSEAVGSFDFGAGYFRFDDPKDEPMMVDSIHGGLHWDGTRRRIVVDPVKLVAGQTTGSAGGFVALPEREGDPWLVNLQNAGPWVAAPDHLGQKTVVIDYVALTGRLFLGEKRFIVDRMLVGGPQAGLAMAGDVDWTNGPRLRFGASLDPTPIATVARLWPSFLVPPLRSYLIDHVKQGIIQKGTMQFDFNAADLAAMRAEHAPPDESLLIDFNVVNGSVEFLSGVPPLTGVDGVGHVTGRTTTFTTTSAGLLEAGGGVITAAEGGTFRIADAEQKPTPAVIVAKVAGSVETIGDLLSRDALKPYANLPLDRSTLRGQTDGQLEVDLNLKPDMGPADTSLKIDAVVSDFSAANLLGKEPLEAATLNVAVDPSGLKANGQGRMFGAPAVVEMVQPAGKGASATVHLIMDEAARVKQGLDGVPGITGLIGAAISAPLGANDNIKADVELDLTRAGIDWPGASKPPGRPGRAKFSLTVANGQTSLDQIALDAGAILARGAIVLGPDQSLQSAKFSQVKFSSGDDAKIEALRVGDALKVIVRGTAIDARPFLKTLFASTPETIAPPAPVGAAGASAGVLEGSLTPATASAAPIKEIDFDVKSALLSGYNKQVITAFEMKMLKHGDQYRQLSFAGRFGRDTVSGNLTGPPNGSRLMILSDDAGSLLQFTDLYRHMENGRLVANMDIGPPNLSGVLTIDVFVLRDEPALRRLVAEGVPAKDPSGKPLKIDPSAMAFNRLQVRFERDGTRLALNDGVMNGDSIGLTVDGWLDFPHDSVDMKGTFVPAYAVNNLFSKIPLFGAILGGGSNEGLIGVNYRVEGKISSPTLSINPLSVIAPGIFRQIFGVGEHDPPRAGQ
jgi:hypothetical protein